MDKLPKTRPSAPKLRPIARKRHNYLFLLLAILSGILTIYLIVSSPPEESINLQYFTISIIPIFFISLSIFIFSLGSFLFFRPIQGIIFVIFILSYIAMRLIGLTHWIFLLLVITLFITIEFMILKKK